MEAAAERTTKPLPGLQCSEASSGEACSPEQAGCVPQGLIPRQPRLAIYDAILFPLPKKGRCPSLACAHCPLQGAPSHHVLCCPEPASICFRFEFPGRFLEASQRPVNFLTWLPERQRAWRWLPGAMRRQQCLFWLPAYLRGHHYHQST